MKIEIKRMYIEDYERKNLEDIVKKIELEEVGEIIFLK